MREINRVKDALEWCDKAIEMIEQDPGNESFKLGYAHAAIMIIQSKLTRELEARESTETYTAKDVITLLSEHGNDDIKLDLYQKAIDDELRGVDPDFAKIIADNIVESWQNK